MATFDNAAAPRLPGDDFNVPFEEAIAWARERKAKLPAEFYGARLQAVRARSFTVGGLAALDQIQQVADAAAQATASGQTLREWRKALAPEALSLGKARTELIFRNAVQTNYGIGRTIQQRANAAARPYLMWDAINDGRTRPTHRAMDGHVAPIDAPIWKRWHPPAGHNCRCTRISLTQEQAQRRGLGTPAPDAQPDAGWEGDPSEGNEDLLRIVRGRMARCDVGSFAYKNPNQPLWCSGPPRALAERLDYAMRVGKRSISDPLAMQYRILTFIQQAEASGGQGSAMVVGDFAGARELFDALPAALAARALFVNRVSIQPSYLLHIKHQHGPGGIKADRGVVAPEVILHAEVAANAARSFVLAGQESHAGLPLVTSVYAVLGVVYRWVWEVKPGRRSMTLFNVYPIKAESAGDV